MGFLDESTLSAFQTQIPRRYVLKFFFIRPDALVMTNIFVGVSHIMTGAPYTLIIGYLRFIILVCIFTFGLIIQMC